MVKFFFYIFSNKKYKLFGFLRFSFQITDNGLLLVTSR